MRVFMFASDKVDDLFFALDQDGTVLSTFGSATLGARVAEYEGVGYHVEVVELPRHHRELQFAIQLNKLRATASNNGKRWAEVELFRWQYGELPEANDPRLLSLHQGTQAMAVAVTKGQVSHENVAMVLLHLASLLTEHEEYRLD